MHRALVVLVVLALTVVLAACGRSERDARPGGGEYVVAVAGPLTGSSAAYGDMVRRAAELKVTEVNAAGGVRGHAVRLVYGDDLCDPKEAATVAQKFASDRRIPIVIGHICSSSTLAAKPIYRGARLVAITPGSTNVEVTRGSRYMFRVIYHDDFQGQFLARYARRVLGYTAIAVFYDSDDYGIGLKDAFVAEARVEGIRVVAQEAYTKDTSDFTPQLTAIKVKNPDALFISGLYKEGGLIASQARRLGMTVPLLGADGLGSPEYLTIAGQAAEGTYVTTPFQFDGARGPAKEMLEKFRAAYGRDPDWNAAAAYDAVGIALEALRAVGPDRDKIADFLRHMTTQERGYAGVTGVTVFDEHGEVSKPAYVSVVRNGRFVSAPRQMLDERPAKGA